MNSIQEVAKSLIAEMQGTREFDPSASKHFARIALIDYANALRRSPERSPEENQRWLVGAYEYHARAVACGANEDELDESFARIRAYWIPKLKETPCPAK